MATTAAKNKTPAASKPANDKKATVFNIADLEKDGVELQISPETQKLDWKLNTSPGTVDDKEALKKPLCQPLIKKIDLRFPLGLEVTARNLKGVTIKDALDAIHKQYKKKEDDEMEEPYLAGFEWDKEESWTKLTIHTKKEATGGMKKKKKNAE